MGKKHLQLNKFIILDLLKEPPKKKHIYIPYRFRKYIMDFPSGKSVQNHQQTAKLILFQSPNF